LVGGAKFGKLVVFLLNAATIGRLAPELSKKKPGGTLVNRLTNQQPNLFAVLKMIKMVKGKQARREDG
jgi:hypothetical protein